jgi:hypothetical protein
MGRSLPSTLTDTTRRLSLGTGLPPTTTVHLRSQTWPTGTIYSGANLDDPVPFAGDAAFGGYLEKMDGGAMLKVVARLASPADVAAAKSSKDVA